MPDGFILSYTSFDDNNQPFIDIEANQVLSRVLLIGQELSLNFQTIDRYCTGWVDLGKGTAMVCPDGLMVDAKFQNCLQCNKRTGFNPAFYNTQQISAVQAKINQKPHFVYLAYFAPDSIKVGITQESRGIRRITEQGARMALKLQTFADAYVARQYEERISRQLKLPETVSNAKKLQLLSVEFEPALAEKALFETKKDIERALDVEFVSSQLIQSEQYYCTEPLDLKKVVHIPGLNQLSGQVIAVVGSILISKYRSRLLAYNLKSFMGYRADQVNRQIDIELPSEQLALF